jgi:hypothetical protein
MDDLLDRIGAEVDPADPGDAEDDQGERQQRCNPDRGFPEVAIPLLDVQKYRLRSIPR